MARLNLELELEMAMEMAMELQMMGKLGDDGEWMLRDEVTKGRGKVHGIRAFREAVWKSGNEVTDVEGRAAVSRQKMTAFTGSFCILCEYSSHANSRRFLRVGVVGSSFRGERVWVGKEVWNWDLRGRCE